VLLSSFPSQKLTSWGEWLVVPMMNWLLLGFLPLKKVYTSFNKSLVAANGQFMMINREHYKLLGGHEKFKDAVVEDMEIARATKQSKKLMMTALGSSGVECRMYDGLKSAFNGFSKNFFAGFNTSVFPFTMLIFYFLLTFLAPFFIVFASTNFLVSIILILVIRILISVKSRQNLFINAVLHPIQMIFVILVGINSVIASKTKRLEWKGRKI
jgi:chlorobactene glucosyltransferase